jgi:cytosine/adenosine deaminase-related metal-dependent hydrolase
MGCARQPDPGAARRAAADRRGACRVCRAGHGQPAFARLSARAGRPDRKGGRWPGQLLDLARPDVPLRANITPEQIEAIAAQLFSECLRHGYTALCEFHYIQRDPDGALYARPAEMAERVAAAGQQAGIGLTLLPVLYSHSGFGEQPLKPEQQRFRTDVDDVLRIVEALEPLRGGQLEVGAAPHSLRAAGIARSAN